MTWTEFVSEVENVLLQNGRTRDIDIEHIDIDGLADISRLKPIIRNECLEIETPDSDWRCLHGGNFNCSDGHPHVPGPLRVPLMSVICQRCGAVITRH